jgi:hypothetical protein
MGLGGVGTAGLPLLFFFKILTANKTTFKAFS